MIVPIIHNPINKFTVATVHYSLDPQKATKEWIEEAMRGMPENGWRREYEIDYTFFAGKPFYPEFTQYNISKEPIQYQEREVLYRGWDYGFHRPCCLITKLNTIDQWCLMKCILGQDEDIRTFGGRVREYCLSTYPGAKYIDADDIAGMQKNDKSETTSRQMLNMIGIYPTGRKQEISEGATIIRQKLKLRVDGVPGLLVDPRETYLIDSFKGGIHYPEFKEGTTEKEYYEKEGFYEHCISEGTQITTDQGLINIEKIQKGTKVLTRNGFKPVMKRFDNGIKKTMKIIFSDGKELEATGDHKIWVKNKGWVTVDSMRYGDIIETCENQNKSFSMGKNTIDIPTHLVQNLENIFAKVEVEKDFMWLFGNIIMGQFFKDIISIIKMEIRSIMIFLTWNVYLSTNTLVTIPSLTLLITRNIGKNKKNIWKQSDHSQRNGINQLKEGNGIVKMGKKLCKKDHRLHFHVAGAVKNIKQNKYGVNFVITIVNPVIGGVFQSILRKGNVLFVLFYSKLINILKQKPVQKNVPYLVAKLANGEKHVYNLHIQDTHEYFANGILVKNCGDTMRYLATEMFTLTGQQQQENSIAASILERQWADGRPRSGNDPNEIIEDPGMIDLLGDMGGDMG